MRQKTSIETYFLQILDFFDKEGADVMVQGSTLLNILRRQTIEPRITNENKDNPSPPTIHTEDKEINLYMLAEDFTSELYVKMRTIFPYFNSINNRMPNSGIFFGQSMWEQNIGSNDHWSIEPGFTYLNLLWQGRTTRFKYQGGDNCILVPNKYVSDKDKWTKIKFLGREINAPADVGDYLSYYYGNWKEEDMGWHWSKSPHYIKFDELINLKEIPC